MNIIEYPCSRLNILTLTWVIGYPQRPISAGARVWDLDLGYPEPVVRHSGPADFRIPNWELLCTPWVYAPQQGLVPSLCWSMSPFFLVYHPCLPFQWSSIDVCGRRRRWLIAHCYWQSNYPMAKSVFLTKRNKQFTPELIDTPNFG